MATSNRSGRNTSVISPKWATSHKPTAGAVGVAPPASFGLQFTVTPELQALYERRWMWYDGRPMNALRSMLGERACSAGNGSITFFVNAEQLVDLGYDLLTLTRHQPAAPVEVTPPVRRKRAPATRKVADAFEPLRCPPNGKAKRNFEDHVMRSIRDFVHFTQSGDYTDKSLAEHGAIASPQSEEKAETGGRP